MAHTANATAGWCEQRIDYQLFCLKTTLFAQNQWCLKTGNLFQVLFQVFGLLSLIVYLRYQRNRRRTNKMLLPIYEVYIRALFCVVTLTSIVQLIENDGIVARPPGPGTWYTFASVGFTWAAYHVLIEGVVFLLLSRTLGSKTLRRVKWLSCCWFITTYLLVGGAAYFGTNNPQPWRDTVGLFMFELWNVSLFLFYLVVAFVPQRMIPCHRRPSAKTFAVFFIVVRLGNLMADVLTIDYVAHSHRSHRRNGTTLPTTPSSHSMDKPAVPGERLFDVGYCLNYLFTGVVFSVLLPFVVFFALLKDSMHWRGNAKLVASPFTWRNKKHRKRNTSRSPEPDIRQDIRAPLMGLDLNSGEVSVVHRQMENLPEDLLIDFYDLSLNPMSVLGTGGTARVYRGVLKGKPVAIKMLVCVELTQELVATFFQEAVTLSVLSKCHPNIVDIKGVCVAPPALCIVLELCAGSLFDAWNESKDAKKRAISLNKVKTQHQHSRLNAALLKRSQLTHSYNSQSRKRPNPTTNRSHSYTNQNSSASSSFLSIFKNTTLPWSNRSKSLSYSSLGGRSVSSTGDNRSSFFSQNTDPISTQNAMTYYQNIQQRPRSLSNTTPSIKTHPLVSAENGTASTPGTDVYNTLNNSDSDKHINQLFMFLDEAIQCVRPVAFLHSLQPPRCHRDIKSLNYLVAKSIAPYRKHAGLGPMIKLADMETVSIVQEQEQQQETVSMSGSSNRSSNSVPPVAFTPQWCSPEIMKAIMKNEEIKSFEPSSDVYSLTMVVYECLVHEVPFFDLENFAPVDELVVNQQKRPTLPKWIPKDLVRLFKSGWHQSVHERCTAMDLLNGLIRLYHLCGAQGVLMMKYQQAVSHATVLNHPRHGLQANRRYRMGATYENCCLGTELVNFVISHSHLFGNNFVGVQFRGGVKTMDTAQDGFSERKSKSKTEDTRRTKEMEFKESEENDWTTTPIMTKKNAKEILQNLMDRKLLKNCVNDSRVFEDRAGITYYYLFPRKFKSRLRKSDHNNSETMMRMKYG